MTAAKNETCQRPAKQALAGRKSRDSKGRFAKGTSGNPRGRRPRGLATVEKLRTSLADELPAIIQSLVKKAKEGDISACKLILERVLPPLKVAELPVALGELGGTRTEQGQAILHEMAAGMLTPGEAARLLAALASQAKVVEVDELERRLVNLEQKLAGNNEQH